MPNQESYFAFAGTIDQQALHRLFNGFGVAMGQGVGRVHLLFQSTGGLVSDGVCLYNYFKGLPIELAIYNAGSVASVATIAFLGVERRYASRHSTFMIHRTYISQVTGDASKMQAFAGSLLIDDKRTEEILRAHVTMPEDVWALHKVQDVIFTADEAVRYGFARDIRDFAPPKGTQVVNL